MDLSVVDVSATLAPYRKWLYKISYLMVVPEQVDDLAQEGWIAMWKSLATFDPDKGALPSWVTTAAKMRMLDVVRGRPLTGEPGARGHIRYKAALPIDMDEEWVEERLAQVEQTAADYAELAYHQGEIQQALSELPPVERVFIEQKVMGDMGRYGWRSEARKMSPHARYHLESRLSHLKEYV